VAGGRHDPRAEHPADRVAPLDEPGRLDAASDLVGVPGDRVARQQLVPARDRGALGVRGATQRERDPISFMTTRVRTTVSPTRLPFADTGVRATPESTSVFGRPV
jgi:hypothetical protein